MKRFTGVLVALATVGLLVGGCSKSVSESKNMAQIYAEEGVPVKTVTVKAAPFETGYKYNATLNGIRESAAYASVSDKVDRIRVQVGDRVEKDSVLMTFPTDNPSAQYFQAKTAFENARATFERMSNYFKAGGLSAQDYDNAQAQFKVAEANWDAVRQAVMVKAPIGGVVSRINVRETDNVEKEDELFAVSQIDRMKARIWVPEKQIADLNVGQKAAAEWQGLTIHGEVVQVDMSMNKARQAFGVVIEFDNPGVIPNCGVTATVTVATYDNQSAITVDRKNIVREGDVSYVYVADADTAVKRQVALGRSQGIDVEVVDGLAAGDILITEGQMLLDDGARIKVVDGPGQMVSEK